MTQYIHHSPGRLRIKFSQLRNNPVLARQTESTLRMIDGVTSVEVSTINGSLLVRYSVSGAARETMIASIHAATHRIGLGFDTPQNMAMPARIGHSVAHTLADKFVGMAVEKCVERSAFLLLGALL